jgi:acyl carrier protein
MSVTAGAALSPIIEGSTLEGHAPRDVAEDPRGNKIAEDPRGNKISEDPRWDEIIGIVSKETSIERARLTPQASIEALGIPSLDMVQTVFELESHFDIEVPVLSDKAGSEFTTVGDLVSHVIAALDRARHARSSAI